MAFHRPVATTAAQRSRRATATSTSPTPDAVFQNALTTLDSLKSGVVKLHSTLEEMRAQHCFDAADIAITQTVFDRRLAEFNKVHAQLATMLKLYKTDIAALQESVAQKEAVLVDLDKRFGMISAEPQLRDHFASRIASNQALVNTAKDELCKAIQAQLPAVEAVVAEAARGAQV
jgi:hypothetical protein